MTNEQILKTLLSEFWEETSFRPDAKNIQPFWDRLNEYEVDKLIVYNFLNYQATYLENFLLSIFPLWKDLELFQWKEIFKQIEGNWLAEYYMKVISDRFLGIDPGFESTKGLSITAITFPDNQVHNASNFVPMMTGKLRERYEKNLSDNYGITFADLIEVNKRLVNLTPYCSSEFPNSEVLS